MRKYPIIYPVTASSQTLTLLDKVVGKEKIEK
jgi:hypothetical protein